MARCRGLPGALLFACCSASRPSHLINARRLTSVCVSRESPSAAGPLMPSRRGRSPRRYTLAAQRPPAMVVSRLVWPRSAVETRWQKPQASQTGAAACKRTVAEATFGLLPILLQRVLCSREEARQQGNLLRRGTEIDGESKSPCKPAKIGRGVKWGCERIGVFVPMRNAIAFRSVVDYRAATCTPSGTS
jgi:hypothetical protein